ncbi:membrane protein insertase YidC [Streptomyces sp. NPDC006368]|uniref:YidC/Oxa1 family membrane protein insertase n=1 Tax=Streptomyces sp. NPDC006368 TaxID=3156760 RepID=UPI0033B0095C
MSVFASLVEHLADLLRPLFHTSAAAAAIVLFTALVRLAVHPLARAAARGQRARTRLAPQVARLREKYGEDPERLRRAVLELHAAEKVSPHAGCLPGLLQLPAFFLMYQLFSGGRLGGHTLLGAPLGGHWTEAVADGGLFGPSGLVYAALFVIVAAVATYAYRRTRREMAGSELPGAGLMPLLGFGTLVTVAVVPLAAALYVVTSTAWTAAERAYLYRDTPGATGR